MPFHAYDLSFPPIQIGECHTIITPLNISYQERKSRMLRTILGITIALSVGFLCVPFGVTAAELTPQSLAGTWAKGGKDQCSVAGYEYLLFRENGTFEFGREKRGEAVGFWTIGDKDIVEIDMLTSPAFYADVEMDLSAYHGTFSYFEAKLVILNFSGDSFDAVAILGAEIGQTIVGRCS